MAEMILIRADLDGREIAVNFARPRPPLRSSSSYRGSSSRGAEECRDYARGSCNRGDDCRYEHAFVNLFECVCVPRDPLHCMVPAEVDVAVPVRALPVVVAVREAVRAAPVVNDTNLVLPFSLSQPSSYENNELNEE